MDSLEVVVELKLASTTLGELSAMIIGTSKMLVLCVVCWGIRTAVAATLRSSFARGRSRMWLNDVDCTGTEEHIGLCSHSGWGEYSSSCSHSREAGVICGGRFDFHMGEMNSNSILQCLLINVRLFARYNSIVPSRM